MWFNIELQRKTGQSLSGYTLLFYQIEPLKNGASLILPSSIARNSSAPNAKRIFEILWGILEIIQFILSDKHLDGAGRSPRHFLDKVRKWHLHSTSNEVIWSKNFSNSMHRSKSAILAIFQTGPWWPGTVSAALKNPLVDFKNSFSFGCRWFPGNTGRQN